MARNRRRWLAALSVLAVGLLLLYAMRGSGAPGRDTVAEDLVMGGDLLAYKTGDGAPLVVFRSADGLAVRRDRLRRDWISVVWPPAPAWQLSGDWFSIVTTGQPASVGLVPSSPAELFGEVNDPAITTLEVEYEGAWYTYEVSAPGYLVRLEGFDGVPTAYRWRDAAGNVIHTRDFVEPLQRYNG